MNGSGDLAFRVTRRDNRRLLFGLLGLELLFAVFHVLLFVTPGLPFEFFRLLFDLGGEVSLPTWFSTTQLAAVGGVLLLGARVNPEASPLSASHFRAGGLAFLFLSADEAASIHERIGLVVKNQEWLSTSWYPGEYGGWVVVYGLLGVVFLILIARPLRKMWDGFPRESRLALGGVAVYLCGAVGLQVVSFLFLDARETPLWYQLGVVVEEFLEMAGASLLLYVAVGAVRKLPSWNASRGQVESPSK